jgi:anti-sigma factor RsiW
VSFPARHCREVIRCRGQRDVMGCVLGVKPSDPLKIPGVTTSVNSWPLGAINSVNTRGAPAAPRRWDRAIASRPVSRAPARHMVI